MHSTTLIIELALELGEARKGRITISSFGERYPDLSEGDAYDIQLHNVERAQREGDRLIGYKIGLTSREAQRQFNVFQPDYGHLLSSMAVPEESEIETLQLIQPKIEGELAFVLDRGLKGPGLTVADAIRAVGYVTVALEIVDTAFQGWKLTFPDLVADNAAGARFVLSAVKRPIDDLDLSLVGMAFNRNGEVWATGAGAAVLGNPLNALTALANQLGVRGRELQPGDVILSGAFTALAPVSPGDYFSCEVGQLGKVSVRFSPEEKR